MREPVHITEPPISLLELVICVGILEFEASGLKNFNQAGSLDTPQQRNQNIFCMLGLGDYFFKWHIRHIAQIMCSVPCFNIKSLWVTADLFDQLDIRQNIKVFFPHGLIFF